MKKSREVVSTMIPDSSAISGMHRVEIELTGQGIAIRPTGFGNKHCRDGRGIPLYLRFRDGVPYLFVWDDINRVEPSHVIAMHKAAEWLREE